MGWVKHTTKSEAGMAVAAGAQAGCLARGVAQALMGWSLAVTPFLVPATVLAQVNANPATVRNDYDIAAGALTEVLAQFTRQSGAPLDVGNARIADLSSPGVRGNHTRAEALALILQGSGYVADRQGDRYVLMPTGNTGAAAEIIIVGFRAREQGSATKTALSIRETPQSISVTTRESMEARQVRDITSALELTAGLTSGIAADGGPFAGRGLGGGEGFLMRGQELQGRRDVRMDGFVVASRVFDTVAFERIEVVKGPSSVLYGQGSLGGFINMIRRKPQAERSSSMATQVASWDNYRAEFDTTGAFDEEARFRGRLTAAYDTGKSFTDFVETDVLMVAPSLAMEFDNDLTVLAQVLYQRDEYTPSRGTPLRGEGNELFIPDISRSLFTGVPSQDKSTGEVHLATIEIDKPIGDNWLMALLFQKSGVKSERFFDAYSNACCLDTTGSVVMYSDTSVSDGDSWAGELRLDGRFELFQREHRVLMGLEHAQRDDVLAFGYTYLGPGNLYTREFQAGNVIPGGARFQNLDFNFTNENQDQAVYGQLLLTLSDRLKLLVGGRYDKAEVEHLNNNTQQLDTWDDGELTTRVGLTAELTDNITAFGVYAQTFNPTVDARSESGRILDPETGEGLEFGVKTDWLDGRLGVSASIFRQELDNIPILDPANDLFNISGGLQRTDGIELEVSGTVTEGFTVGAALTWLDSEYIEQDDPNYGKAPFGLIKHQGSLFVSYELQTGSLRGLGFGMTYVDVGRREQFDSFLEGYDRLDLNLYYNAIPQWQFSLQMRNAGDERYIERLRDRYQDNFFGSPRAMLFRAEYQF